MGRDVWDWLGAETTAGRQLVVFISITRSSVRVLGRVSTRPRARIEERVRKFLIYSMSIVLQIILSVY